MAFDKGYLPFTFGTTEYIDWSRVANKPTTLEEYGITDAYTKEQIQEYEDDLYNQMKEYLTSMYKQKMEEIEIIKKGIDSNIDTWDECKKEITGIDYLIRMYPKLTELLSEKESEITELSDSIDEIERITEEIEKIL